MHHLLQKDAMSAAVDLCVNLVNFDKGLIGKILHITEILLLTTISVLLFPDEFKYLT